MRAHQAKYPVDALCRNLAVSASGYYAWRKRTPSQRRQSDVLLGDRVESIYLRSRSTYGRPRVHAELRDDGIAVSGKRVARLMRERGLCGASRRKFVVTTVRDKKARPAPDLVARRFTAERANQLWVADISVLQQHRKRFVVS